ncbi:MAG: hypothetical protein C0490_15665 [Marivirga sp.]|nr:hypothetical protein [Marivirga sp.]
MTLRLILICAGALGIASCSTKENNGNSNLATGVYVREYSFEVTNPETGLKIGMRQVRDSIFVQPGNDAYQVSNRKWRMNDYDNEGWVSMAHADDRPLPTFLASYDANTNSLNSNNSNVSQTIVLDTENEKLYKGKPDDKPYIKVR